jgi:hypothetical protein
VPLSISSLSLATIVVTSSSCCIVIAFISSTTHVNVFFVISWFWCRIVKASSTCSTSTLDFIAYY